MYDISVRLKLKPNKVTLLLQGYNKEGQNECFGGTSTPWDPNLWSNLKNHRLGARAWVAAKLQTQQNILRVSCVVADSPNMLPQPQPGAEDLSAVSEEWFQMTLLTWHQDNIIYFKTTEEQNLDHKIICTIIFYKKLIT